MAEAEKQTILVVDDEPVMRRIVVTVLSAGGYRVLEAENGPDALRTIHDDQPDLALLDVRMPGMSGLDVARRLKSDPETRQIAIIMLTGQSEESEMIAGLEAGADDYVTKPFSSGALLARVRAHLRLRFLQNELVRLEKERAEAKLEFARDVQRCLLPDDPPSLDGLDLVVHCRSSEQVGGDFIDFIKVGEDRLYLILGDAEGHGVSAALWMSAARSYVRASIADRVVRPAKLMEGVNTLICQDPGYVALLPMVCVLFDARRGTLQYANAGHPYPYLLSARSKEHVRLQSTGPALGVADSADYSDVSLQFEEGDTLLCYTDGLTEAAGLDGMEFGEERLEELLGAGTPGRPGELADSILGHWEGHADHGDRDDMTLVLASRVSVCSRRGSPRRAGREVLSGAESGPWLSRITERVMATLSRTG